MIDGLELRRDEFTVRVDSLHSLDCTVRRIKLEILRLEHVVSLMEVTGLRV
jgi:hypothetical protein